MSAEDVQLETLGRLDALLCGNGIDYWLFGGWAVDFHAGAVSRAHDDLDIAVWLDDQEALERLLTVDGWSRTEGSDDDGFAAYRCGDVVLEVAFLARDADGTIFTPAGDERGEWPPASFGDTVAELHGVQARVVGLESLLADKSLAHDDQAVAAKDRLDVATLEKLATARFLADGLVRPDLIEIFDRFAAGDASAIEAFQPLIDRAAPDVVWDSTELAVPDVPDVVYGPAAIMDFFSRWLAAWSVFSWTTSNFEVRGDDVIYDVRIKARSRHTGLHLDQRVAHRMTLRDGKLVAWRLFLNRDDA